MRVELTEADAEMIRRCITSYRGSDSAPEFAELDRLADLLTPPVRLTAILSDADGTPICPRCGNGAFSYEEGCSQYWPFGTAEDGAVFCDTIGWDGIGESGDGEPGLFCDHYRYSGCGAPIDLPDGWEVEFT